MGKTGIIGTKESQLLSLRLRALRWGLCEDPNWVFIWQNEGYVPFEMPSEMSFIPMEGEPHWFRILQ